MSEACLVCKYDSLWIKAEDRRKEKIVSSSFDKSTLKENPFDNTDMLIINLYLQPI